ncbi:MAG: pirin family protein [Deltaproteobacteria bacterium]|nr:pirin family protein [Deltaproteobacteria bacterium]MBK9647455.1 pirin family protein [Deltaproteobacteria bacterium]
MNPVLQTFPLGGPPWPTLDPFLFCVHHVDAYPRGDGQLAPAAPLTGRQIGQDFGGKDGWSMYHGRRVPGFPQHPHRGFETVTVTRQGFIDHADSMGARARYGQGDVQWMTAGKGVVHAEMFPLLNTEAPNPAELFQIWLNLPAKNKMVPPHFTMFWSQAVPQVAQKDENGRFSTLTVVAGAYGEARPPAPPPDSWAAAAEAELAIWTLRMDDGARFTVPAAKPGVNRMIYLFAGDGLGVGEVNLPPRHGARLQGDAEVTLVAKGAVELLLLQGRPIGEPVVSYGPFVMNTTAQIQQAFRDYQTTQFGGWPWPDDGPVHGHDAARFAVHADGKEERP